MTLRALDLYCKAGGATRGLQQAGFHVTGVDIQKQPHYCGDKFIQANALEFEIDPAEFDFIWASPPCQAHTALKTMHNAKHHEDLIPQTRAKLVASGLPFAIENVPGAPLIEPILLCGTMFKLGVEDAELRRHRIFEVNFSLSLGQSVTTIHARKFWACMVVTFAIAKGQSEFMARTVVTAAAKTTKAFQIFLLNRAAKQWA